MGQSFVYLKESGQTMWMLSRPSIQQLENNHAYIVFIIQFESLMSRPLENYLTLQNGCSILECSSERDGSPATNILSPQRKDIWLINQALPQHCVIDTSRMRARPARVYNKVGFDCWHQYDSNPKVIELAYRGKEGEEWTSVGRLRLNNQEGRQYFRVKEIPVDRMGQLRVTMLENYNSEQTSKPTTYLNQIELGYLPDQPLPQQMPQQREKTFSDFKKLTSTQKQLKKSQEQVKRMAVEQEELKSIVARQQALILEMQQGMKTMAKELEKVKREQEVQGKKVTLLVKKQYIPSSGKRKGTESFTYELEENEEEQQEVMAVPQQQVRHIEDTLISQNTVGLVSRSAQHSRSQATSKHHSRDSRQRTSSNQRSRTSKQHHPEDSELSEYDPSEQEHSKYSEKCSEMMVRLQVLIQERNRREKELKRRNQELRL